MVLLHATSRFLESFFPSMFQVLYTVSDFRRHEITNFLNISILDNLYFSVNRLYKEDTKTNVYSDILIHRCVQKYIHTNTWEKT